LLAELSLDPVDRVLVGPAVPREAENPAHHGDKSRGRQAGAQYAPYGM
jgi:hypothetical protein